MPDYFTIELKSLRFFAAHGLYQEELTSGNEFQVDLKIDIPGKDNEKVPNLEQTVDYVKVYRIVKEAFSHKKQLLENSAVEIADHIEQVFPLSGKIVVCIRKLNPPITGFSGSVGVTYTRISSPGAGTPG